MTDERWLERFTEKVSVDCKWCGEHVLLIPAELEDGRIEVQICDPDPDLDGWVHVNRSKRRAFVDRWFVYDEEDPITSYYRHNCPNHRKVARAS